MTTAAKGILGSRVTFDGYFVEISKTRLDVTGGGTKRIPVHAITAVQLKPPGVLTNGFIQFTTAGGNEVRSSFGRQVRDAAADENAVVFRRKQAAQFVALRDAVEQVMVLRT